MKKDKDLVYGRFKVRTNISQLDKVQSLQDKTGATAQQIRQAIEVVGFDRVKVEQYLMTSR